MESGDDRGRVDVFSVDLAAVNGAMREPRIAPASLLESVGGTLCWMAVPTWQFRSAREASAGGERSPGRICNMLRRLVPLACALALLGVTAAVWRLQVENRRQQLARHTDDVCTQAARRLETFVATQLSVAGMLAEHWSRQREQEADWPGFRDLASLVLSEFASYHALVLVGGDGQPLYAVDEPDSSSVAFLNDVGRAMLEQAVRRDQPVVSDPYQLESGAVSFFAAWQLVHGSPRDASHLLVEYRVEELIADCFHGQIRSEFSYSVEDQGRTLFRFAHAGNELSGVSRTIRSVQTFPVQNRTWRLSVTPRPDLLRVTGWTADLSVPIFGLALSLGVGLLVHLLLLRMERLRLSEARYRGVFDSATDGLFVLAGDVHGTIQDANPAARRIFGWQGHDLIGMPFGGLLGTADGCSIEELSVQLDRRHSVRFEATASRRDGDLVDVEVHASRFIHQGGPAILAIVADVSERRLAARRQLLLSQRALAAQEEERARLARELHDELGQLLTGLRLELDYIRRQHRDWTAVLVPANGIVATAIDTVRRLCRGLRPPLLDDLGLESAARQLIDEFAARTECRVELGFTLDEMHHELPAGVTLCVYRVLQEALTNVSRHAAASTVGVQLAIRDGELVLTVVDDGVGFEMSRLSEASGLGITGMLERAALVDGRLDIASAELAGTRIEMRVPIQHESKGRVTA